MLFFHGPLKTPFYSAKLRLWARYGPDYKVIPLSAAHQDVLGPFMGPLMPFQQRARERLGQQSKAESDELTRVAKIEEAQRNAAATEEMVDSILDERAEAHRVPMLSFARTPAIDGRERGVLQRNFNHQWAVATPDERIQLEQDAQLDYGLYH